MKWLISIGLALLSIFELNMAALSCDGIKYTVSGNIIIEGAGICQHVGMLVCGTDNKMQYAQFSNTDCSGTPVSVMDYEVNLPSYGYTDIETTCCSGSQCDFAYIAIYNTDTCGDDINGVSVNGSYQRLIGACSGVPGQQLYIHPSCSAGNVTYSTYNGQTCDGTPLGTGNEQTGDCVDGKTKKVTCYTAVDTCSATTSAPGITASGTTSSGTTGSGTTSAATTGSATTGSATTGSGTTGSGTTGSGTTSAATTTGSGTTGSGTTGSGTTSAATTTGSGTTGSVTTASGTTKSGTTASGTTSAGTTASGTTSAGTTGSGTTKSATTGSGTTGSGTTGSGTTKSATSGSTTTKSVITGSETTGSDTTGSEGTPRAGQGNMCNMVNIFISVVFTLFMFVIC